MYFYCFSHAVFFPFSATILSLCFLDFFSSYILYLPFFFILRYQTFFLWVNGIFHHWFCSILFIYLFDFIFYWLFHLVIYVLIHFAALFFFYLFLYNLSYINGALFFHPSLCLFFIYNHMKSIFLYFFSGIFFLIAFPSTVFGVSVCSSDSCVGVPA